MIDVTGRRPQDRALQIGHRAPEIFHRPGQRHLYLLLQDVRRLRRRRRGACLPEEAAWNGTFGRDALLQAIAVLLSLAAVLSIGQILFCLRRWYGFRHAECEINPEAPRPESWAWLFEGMYCVGMGVSVIFAWWGVRHFEAILAKL